MKDNEVLNTLFYNAEEYYHMNNMDYKPYADYVESLLSNIDNVEDENLKLLLTNWNYKNKVYKTININSITVPYNKNMSLNILYGLMIRECSRYDYNTHPTTLHIEYIPSENEIISLEFFKRIEEISSLFKKKKIHFYNDTTFIGDIGEYLHQHDYEFIYEVDCVSDIKTGMTNIHTNITDDNIKDFETFIQTAIKENCNRLYVTNSCKNGINIDLYRYELDEFIFKYNNMSFSIISEDYIPGKYLYVNDEYVGLKLNTTIELYDKTLSIAEVTKLLKMNLIDNQYICNKCIDCSEKVLCLLGATDERCSYKMF